MEILATTNANGGGKVIVFSRQNQDFKAGPSAWVKHVIADGYVPKSRIMPGVGSPGTASAYFIGNNT